MKFRKPKLICYDWDNTKITIDLNLFNDFFEDENNLDLPLDKIVYRKKMGKRRNKSQDKSTNIERIENYENNNDNDSEQIIFQKNNACCIIV